MCFSLALAKKRWRRNGTRLTDIFSLAIVLDNQNIKDSIYIVFSAEWVTKKKLGKFNLILQTAYQPKSSFVLMQTNNQCLDVLTLAESFLMA